MDKIISTHNYDDKGKLTKHNFKDETKKAISTRNIIPYGVLKKEIKDKKKG